MKPKPKIDDGSQALFHSRLDNLINPRHELMLLAKVIDWERLDDVFGAWFDQRIFSDGAAGARDIYHLFHFLIFIGSSPVTGCSACGVRSWRRVSVIKCGNSINES